MSVSSELYKVNVVGDGSTPTIAFNRKVFNSTDIKGFKYDATTYIETALVNGTDFTVSGAGDTSSGVTITPSSAIPAGTNWVMFSDAGNAQSTTLTTAGEFPAKSLEFAFDKLAIGTQEADGKADRALKLPISDTASADIPNKADRASKYLGFDANGDPIALAGGTATSSADISYLQGATGSASRTVENKLQEVVSVKDFGAKGDGSTDDTTAIQSAITYAESNGGTVWFPRGTYNTSSEIVLNKPGIILAGEGTGTTWDNSENAASTIQGTHTTGSVIRIKWESCGIKNLVIDANATRSAASRNTTAANYNAGIRVEADDVAAPEGDVFSTSLDHVYVKDQPNDGFLFIGRTYGSLVSDCYSYNNNGHGFCVDSGRRTSRTNRASPGLITVIGGNAFKNQGHGMLLGNSTDAGAGELPSFRCVVINWESTSNEVSASLREDDFTVWSFGDNNSFINCAFSGKDSSDVVQNNSGLVIGGRDSNAERCRYLDCNVPARIRHISGSTTSGITLDRMSIRDSLVTYAVSSDSSVTHSRIDVMDSTSTTSLMNGTPKDGEDTRYLFNRKVHGSLQYSDYKSADKITLADDAAASYEFSGTTYGIVLVNGSTDGAGPCIAAFRVGTSPYCTILAGANANATTGALTGTDGTNAKLNLSGHTDNKLYIENRTSASRNYTVTFLSMDDGGRLLATE